MCCGVPYGTHLWQVADSSELNGCFKIQLTKAKKNYRKFKPINNKSFESSDIIPLVRHAWDLSFGRASVAKKAIAARGWGPLNYVLLDHPGLIRFKKPEEKEIDSNQQPKKSIELNLDGSITGAHLDAIFEDDKLCKSRQKKWEETKEKNEDRATRFKALKEVGCLTVGKLTTHGIHTLSTSEIYEHVRNHEEKKNDEKRELENRKYMAKIKQQTKEDEAIKRYRTNQKLRIDDIKVLLKKYNKDGDSPIRKKYSDVKLQWEQRGVQRLHARLVMCGEAKDADDDINELFTKSDEICEKNEICESNSIVDNISLNAGIGTNYTDNNNCGRFFDDPFDSLNLLSTLALDSSSERSSKKIEL